MGPERAEEQRILRAETLEGGTETVKETVPHEAHMRDRLRRG